MMLKCLASFLPLRLMDDVYLIECRFWLSYRWCLFCMPLKFLAVLRSARGLRSSTRQSALLNAIRCRFCKCACLPVAAVAQCATWCDWCALAKSISLLVAPSFNEALRPTTYYSHGFWSVEMLPAGMRACIARTNGCLEVPFKTLVFVM
jgi:hypothetical protein